MDDSSGTDSLARALTVVVTTSYMRGHPSTLLIEATLSSFANVPFLRDCTKIIVCDGHKIGPKRLTKAGKLCADDVPLYEEYIKALRRLAAGARSPTAPPRSSEW